VNAVAEVIFGLLMSLLALRFKHKSLLLTGLSLVAISATGSFLAPTLDLLLFFSFLEGSGSIIFIIVAFTLIGDLLPLDKKAKAVSWIIAAGYVFSFVGTPLINIFANFGGWRYAFSLLVLPVSVAALILALYGVPSTKVKTRLPTVDKQTYLNNFKQTFLNKSVASCLIGGLFFTGASIGIFAIAFYRQHFLISRDESVLILLAVNLLAIIGSFIPSQLSRRANAKTLTSISFLGNGICSILLFLSSSLWVALIFNFLATIFITMATSSYHCLVLEQVPQSRGTTMSLFRASTGMGCIVAPALAGSLLVLFSSESLITGYLAVGAGLGALNIIAACILYLFTKEQQNDYQQQSSVAVF